MRTGDLERRLRVYFAGLEKRYPVHILDPRLRDVALAEPPPRDSRPERTAAGRGRIVQNARPAAPPRETHAADSGFGAQPPITRATSVGHPIHDHPTERIRVVPAAPPRAGRLRLAGRRPHARTASAPRRLRASGRRCGAGGRGHSPGRAVRAPAHARPGRPDPRDLRPGPGQRAQSATHPDRGAAAGARHAERHPAGVPGRRSCASDDARGRGPARRARGRVREHGRGRATSTRCHEQALPDVSADAPTAPVPVGTTIRQARRTAPSASRTSRARRTAAASRPRCAA